MLVNRSSASLSLARLPPPLHHLFVSHDSCKAVTKQEGHLPVLGQLGSAQVETEISVTAQLT